ncbi:ulp1 protease family, C-terminal catalytic domain-containing protein [Tanacetum coccineum]
MAERLYVNDAKGGFLFDYWFSFGKVEIDPKEEDHSEFRKRVFPGVSNLKGEHLLKLINKDVKFNKLDAEDVVRVCLLLALDYVFMGQELRHVITNAIVNLVDDFYKWDAFPWGEYMWSFFHERVYNVAVDRRKFHLDKLASNPKYEANYVLYGFVFPLKIWALETFSNSLHWWRKSKNVIPRGVAWSNGLKFEKSSYDKLFYLENLSFNKLTPSAIKMNKLGWRSSLDYFKKVTHSITILRSATRGIINSKSVHTRVRIEVHHEVRVRTEVSRVVDKEEVHVRAVDKEDVLTRAVDEEDIRERAELLKTIKEQEQMIVDLQCRLLLVEQITKQLKPGPSNVDHLDQSMEGVSQCMNVNVDEPYKNWNDVLDNFPVNGLDHQPVEGVSQCTILNDEYESVVVDGLISLRSHDVGHISKKSFVRDDPEFKVKENEEASHFDSFLCTQQVRELMNDVKNVLDDVHINSVVKDAEEIKCRKRRCREVNIQTVSKRVIKIVFGSDGNEIQQLPWKVDLTSSPTTPKRIVSMPEVVMALFRDKNRATLKEVGYLVMDLNADWAIASPYLSDMLSRFEYPLYYADGVKYDVPLFANNAQKVYFPINEKDSHWVLGELHIISGLITIYDSLGGPPNGIETRYFLLQLREKLMFQILLYLDNAEVFEKKNIDKLKYSITFRYADGVPLQGGLYGDCGIWVCVFLYRLSHNIPLEVDDPISFALAYRIRMIEFYWKYKMLQ